MLPYACYGCRIVSLRNDRYVSCIKAPMRSCVLLAIPSVVHSHVSGMTAFVDRIRSRIPANRPKRFEQYSNVRYSQTNPMTWSYFVGSRQTVLVHFSASDQ